MIYIKELSIFYAAILSIDIYSEINQNYLLIWIVKPLLMPVLLCLFLVNTDAHHRSHPLEHTFIVLALLFSWFGDLLLLQPKLNLFLYGLVSFLIAHLCYIVSFLIGLMDEGKAFRRRLSMTTMLIKSIPFLLYITFIISIFYPTLNAETDERKSLLMPIILYTFVILTMAYLSSLRDRKAPGFWMVFGGAILFVLSDSFLAFNKFIIPIPTPGFYVMSTYGLGQYLIVLGILKGRQKSVKEPLE